MKTRVLIILLLTSLLTSCEKEYTFENGVTWVCNPEANVTITLAFDNGVFYVETTPENLDPVPIEIGKSYLFKDGEQYVVRGDTLYRISINDNAKVTSGQFIIKMKSSKEMYLHNTESQDTYHLWVKDYLFSKKK